MRAILAALLCLCACQSAAAEAIPLRYGQAYSALRSIFALPLLVAEREGYFVHEGLDFSMLPVPGGGEKLIAALHDGTADISHVATPFLIQAALAGSDLADEEDRRLRRFVARGLDPRRIGRRIEGRERREG